MVTLKKNASVLTKQKSSIFIILVVEDWSKTSCHSNPRNEGDGISSVQSSTVRELDVAVRSAIEIYSASSRSIWACDVFDIAWLASRVASDTDVAPANTTAQRIHSNSSR